MVIKRYQGGIIKQKTVLQEILKKIQTKNCIIEVYGLGYIGLPSAIRLAMAGFQIVGIDKDLDKIKRLKNKNLFESELFLKNEFVELLNSGLLTITDSSKPADKPKVAIICVPTPIPSPEVSSDIYVKNAVESFLKNSKKGDLIILESSIEVGTTDKIKDLIESYGFKVGHDMGLAFCPERIDPQNKKWNLENIPRVIYCSDDITYQICQEIYHNINNANLKRVSDSKACEVVKSFENAFRLVNISFVNELALLCDKLKIDVREVIEAASTKPFGFMPFYPSAGAGGHCIPKDPRFLLNSAKNFGIEFKTLQNSLAVNSYMPTYISSTIRDTITKHGWLNSVLVWGLSYKPDMEDMRDSPGFKIISELKKLGVNAVGYDPFYNKDLKQKYIIENHLDVNCELEILQGLDNELIKSFGCICVVQHHTKIEFDLRAIYKNSQVSLIYDCQNRLEYNAESKTKLMNLGH